MRPGPTKRYGDNNRISDAFQEAVIWSSWKKVLPSAEIMLANMSMINYNVTSRLIPLWRGNTLLTPRLFWPLAMMTPGYFWTTCTVRTPQTFKSLIRRQQLESDTLVIALIHYWYFVTRDQVTTRLGPTSVQDSYIGLPNNQMYTFKISDRKNSYILHL